MKKAGILLVLILSLSFISALDISLSKSSYYPSETLQAEISGGFVDPLILDNIGIYSNNSVHKLPVVSDLRKSGDKYLYYAILPENSASYSLRIENTLHYEGSKITINTFEKNFTASDANSSYLNFNPGFIIASKDFSITIKAFNANQDITISLEEAGFSQKINIGYGSERKIFIPIANITQNTNSKIKINSYSIPVEIIANKYPNQTTPAINYSDMLKVQPKEISSNVLKDTEDTYELYLHSDYLLSDVSISSPSKYISLSNNSIDEFSDTYVIKAVIKAKEDFESFINISIENYSLVIPVTITIISKQQDVNYSSVPVTHDLSCSEMNGTYCLAGETCSSLVSYDSLNKQCCRGTCAKKSASSGWILGLLILVILGIVGWFFYNKAQQGTNPLDSAKSIFSKRAEDYKKRIESPSEARDALSKN